MSIRLHDRFEAMTEPGLQQISLAPLLEHIERVGIVIDTMAGTDSVACGLRAYNPS